MKSFPPNVVKELKNYVYLLIDPRNNNIFYVGKGVGNRCFDHLSNQTSGEKKEIISRIIKDEKVPIIEILSHGLSSEKALAVEAAVIDTLDVGSLLNKQRGHHSRLYGRKSLDNIMAMYDAKDAAFDENGICFKINQHFDERLSPIELYDVTRGFWAIDEKKARNAELAFAVYEGIIQEVYKIISWYDAGTTLSTRSTNSDNRKEFVGQVADEKIRKKYRFKRVAFNSSQAPFEYVPLKSKI